MPPLSGTYRATCLAPQEAEDEKHRTIRFQPEEDSTEDLVPNTEHVAPIRKGVLSKRIDGRVLAWYRTFAPLLCPECYPDATFRPGTPVRVPGLCAPALRW